MSQPVEDATDQGRQLHRWESSSARRSAACRPDVPLWAMDVGAQLVGRGRELGLLGAMLATVQASGSATLVGRGAAGINRTALLEALGREFAGCVVAQVAAPSSERGEQPLVCIIDGAEWLDAESSLIVAFVARRFVSEPVALVFATRSTSSDLVGLPELAVGGLADRDARALLIRALGWLLDRRVQERIVAEARGDRSVLLAAVSESLQCLVASASGGPDAAVPCWGGRQSARLLSGLSEEARMVMLLAAAEPTGEPHLRSRAAEMLRVSENAIDDARATDLVSDDVLVHSSHPLARGVVHRQALPEEQHLAHGALAAGTDAAVDPEGHAWHRAREVVAPDERIAAELERWAVRADRSGRESRHWDGSSCISRRAAAAPRGAVP